MTNEKENALKNNHVEERSIDKPNGKQTNKDSSRKVSEVRYQKEDPIVHEIEDQFMEEHKDK